MICLVFSTVCDSRDCSCAMQLRELHGYVDDGDPLRNVAVLSGGTETKVAGLPWLFKINTEMKTQLTVMLLLLCPVAKKNP